MAEKEAPEAARRLHVTVLLVASRRALDNALGELGFAEDDDRVRPHRFELAPQLIEGAAALLEAALTHVRFDLRREAGRAGPAAAGDSRCRSVAASVPSRRAVARPGSMSPRSRSR